MALQSACGESSGAPHACSGASGGQRRTSLRVPRVEAPAHLSRITDLPGKGRAGGEEPWRREGGTTLQQRCLQSPKRSGEGPLCACRAHRTRDKLRGGGRDTELPTAAASSPRTCSARLNKRAPLRMCRVPAPLGLLLRGSAAALSPVTCFQTPPPKKNPLRACRGPGRA